MPSRSRWSPGTFVHSAREIVPAGLRDPDVGRRNGRGVLRKEVEEHEQILGASVEDSVEVSTEVASKLPKLALDLARIGKAKVRAEQPESLDLVVDDDLHLWWQPVDRVIDRLRSVGRAVVDDRPRHYAVPSMEGLWKCEERAGDAVMASTGLSEAAPVV
jgi:hypothetical protein